MGEAELGDVADVRFAQTDRSPNDEKHRSGEAEIRGADGEQFGEFAPSDIDVHRPANVTVIIFAVVRSGAARVWVMGRSWRVWMVRL